MLRIIIATRTGLNLSQPFFFKMARLREDASDY